jgi:hypothetical protein
MGLAAEFVCEIDATEIEQSFGVHDAGAYLEKVAIAIRERRHYGFFHQELAQSAVSTCQWIAKTTQEVLAEARPESAAVRLPNLIIFVVVVVDRVGDTNLSCVRRARVTCSQIQKNSSKTN